MFSRLIRNRRGSATVESALAVPVLLLLLFGIIEFAFIFFVQNNMVNAAREAARRMAVADLTLAERQAVAESLLLTVGTYTVTTTENAETVAVAIESPTTDASLIAGNAGLLSGQTMQATVVMRKEGS